MRKALAPGSRLGAFEIRALLGAGGMGEVYRARDTQLKRDVAIKVLHASVATDIDRLRRFQLEAEAAAALNHPNILSIFHIGEEDGAPYIVTELLEGETLRSRLRRGSLGVREALDVGEQTARGLAAAHSAGIVHRDLKPENLFIISDGRVKILDFGLAKFAPDGGQENLTATVNTDPAALIGTLAYMSPEQLRGQTVDHRADLFAFGVVLYEMLCGKHPFRRPSSAETMSAILSEEPVEISQLTPALPPALDRVVHRCLAKNPEQRFQSASDLAFALEALSDSGSRPGPAPSHGAARHHWRTALAAAAVMAVIAAVVVWLRLPAAVPKVLGYTQLTDDGVPKQGPLASDGARLYFNEGGRGGYMAMQVSVSGGQTAPVATGLPTARSLAITPDNSSLLVLTAGADLPGGRLWLAPLPAGMPRAIGEGKVSDAGLFRDGRLWYIAGTSLYIADKDGSNPRLIAPADRKAGCGVADASPSPDGALLLFGEYCAQTDHVTLREVPAAGGPSREVVKTAADVQPCCGEWTPDGRYIFFTSVGAGRSDIWISRHGSSFSSRPAAMRLTNGPLSYSDPMASRDGKQIFAIGSKLRGEVVRYDETIHQFVPFLPGVSATDLTFSRDGKWMAYRTYPESSLWRSRADGSEPRQLTWPPVNVWYPFLSPDGAQILFTTGKGIFVINAEGGPMRQLANNECTVAQWTPDGKQAALNCLRGGRHFGDPDAVEIRMLNVATGQVTPIPGSQGKIGPFFPDQNTLLAASVDATRFFTYDFRTRKWSTLATGSFVNWFLSPDGRYLDATTTGPEPMAVRIRIADGKVQPVVSLKGLRRIVDQYTNTQVNVAPDGSLLFTRDIGSQEIYALDVKWP